MTVDFAVHALLSVVHVHSNHELIRSLVQKHN